MSTAAANEVSTSDTATHLPAVAYPILRYRDAPSALAWLQSAFGLREVLIVPNEDGGIMHAELQLNGAVFMLGSAREGSQPGAYEVYVALDADAIDAHHAQAVAAGAEITRELASTGYDSREYSARDSEGNEWSFGTYRPTAAPAG